MILKFSAKMSRLIHTLTSTIRTYEMLKLFWGCAGAFETNLEIWSEQPKNEQMQNQIELLRKTEISIAIFILPHTAIALIRECASVFFQKFTKLRMHIWFYYFSIWYIHRISPSSVAIRVYLYFCALLSVARTYKSPYKNNMVYDAWVTHKHTNNPRRVYGAKSEEREERRVNYGACKRCEIP